MQIFTKSVTHKDLLSVFLKLGILGFGGPAAHIAMMREEVVEKRKWLGKDEFFDLVGATNLIPGPNSTELAIHIGHRMLGWKGLFIAGISFIMPAFFAVLSLAILYVKYGSVPDLVPVLTGIRPIIVAIVLLALWKFRESAVRDIREVAVVLASLVAVYFGVNEVLIIFLAGLMFASSGSFALVPIILVKSGSVPVTGPSLFLFFLKIGSVLFGSGYVLLAFLKNELVDQRMWLTSGQLLDAITVGQVTPGPVFTTATFIGFLLQSYQGAVLATVGIFLPSFFFVVISAPFILKLRASKFFSQFLNGVNAASFALMLFVTIELGLKSLFDVSTIVLGAVAFLILKFTNINSAFVIIAGGVLGHFLF